MKKEVNLEEINSSPKRVWQWYNENLPVVIIGLIVAAIAIGVVVYSSWAITIIITAVGSYLAYFINAKWRKAAVESLLDKYKDQAIVDRIMNDEYWVGMT